jgi:hypothetical protein
MFVVIGNTRNGDPVARTVVRGDKLRRETMLAWAAAGLVVRYERAVGY